MSRFDASPRTPALQSGCSGAMLFGGRKESFPQLRSPPRSGLQSIQCFRLSGGHLESFAFVVRAFGVRPRTTPFLVFKIAFVVSLSLLDISLARLRRRSSFSHGRS